MHGVENMTDPIGTFVDFSDWTRLDEVLAYAEEHYISIQDAIRDLVNEGLSWR